MSEKPAVTQLLLNLSAGDPGALDRLLPVVYDELRRLARRYLNRERSDHTLQPTALVNEVYIKLINQDQVNWQNRAHFFGVAAKAMRHLLIDYAKARSTVKRGQGITKTLLNENFVAARAPEGDLLALDEVLTRLADLDAQQARIVELRFFGGLTVEETAEVLEISTPTVKREWRAAKAWLYRELSQKSD